MHSLLPFSLFLSVLNQFPNRWSVVELLIEMLIQSVIVAWV